MKKVKVLDSTLRDGVQGIGITFSVQDKLDIIKLLDFIGVDYIEAGNPFSNQKEIEFFEKAVKSELKNSKLVSFGSTCRKGLSAQDDDNLNALIKTGTDVCAIFGKSWDFHVEKILEASLAENITMIENSCRFLKNKNREVIYDAEHFFDGYLNNPQYALETLKAACRGGADSICLCDTNGGTVHSAVSDIIKEVQREIDVPLGVHFHDDCGLAAANTISAVELGAASIQGTFIGIGERCGNANLSTVIPTLQLKMGYNCIPESSMPFMVSTAREIAAVANVRLPRNLPYVGRNAFAHKAGMHAHAVLKDTSAYEHVDPDLVGNIRKLPASEISGKAAVGKKIRNILNLDTFDKTRVEAFTEKMKDMEYMGYQFEGADASFELFVRKEIKPYKPFFELLYYTIHTSFDNNGLGVDNAIVKVNVGDKIQLTAGEGNGPVNALDKALRKALEVFYPAISQTKLTDYKVRVLDSKDATASAVRVLITSSYKAVSYTTVGVSEDVVVASWKALVDSMEYFLLKYNGEKE